MHTLEAYTTWIPARTRGQKRLKRAEDESRQTRVAVAWFIWSTARAWDFVFLGIPEVCCSQGKVRTRVSGRAKESKRGWRKVDRPEWLDGTNRSLSGLFILRACIYGCRRFEDTCYSADVIYNAWPFATGISTLNIIACDEWAKLRDLGIIRRRWILYNLFLSSN